MSNKTTTWLNLRNNQKGLRIDEPSAEELEVLEGLGFLKIERDYRDKDGNDVGKAIEYVNVNFIEKLSIAPDTYNRDEE